MLARQGGRSGPEYVLLQTPLDEVRRHGIVIFRHGSVWAAKYSFERFFFLSVRRLYTVGLLVTFVCAAINK
jgi:hypothetical protein